MKNVCYNGVRTTKKGGVTVDWNKLKAEYIAGGTTYRKLAQKHGVSENTLRRRAAKEKWTQERHKADMITTQKVVDKTAESNSNSAVLITKTSESLLHTLALCIARDGLSKEQAETIRIAADALEKLKRVQGIKNPKDAEEQEARILNLRRQAETAINGDKKVEFVLDDVKEYLE